MIDTYGFIVGIEKYDQPQWDTPGPCYNALGMADWLVSIGTAPSNIHVFLDPITEITADIDALSERKVHVTKSGEWIEIDNFINKTLPALGKPNSRLFVYWSGHGFVDPKDTRIFICRDFMAKVAPNRVLNATSFFRHLSVESRFQHFREQIVLADVCGTQSEQLGLRFEICDNPATQVKKPADQVLFFATPEGEYAKQPDGESVFSSIARQVLKDGSGWPDLTAFVSRLRSALEKADVPAFWIECKTKNFWYRPSLVRRDIEGALAHSVISMLSKVNFPDTAFRPHYLRTANALGVPELTQAQGLFQMVKELASLCDESVTGKIPYGLLQFMVRLAGMKGLEKPVQSWLEENAPEQRNDLANIKQRIEIENQVKILLIEVENDPQGRITSFEPFLRTNDLSDAVGEPLMSESVESWEHFCEKIRCLIHTLRQASGITDFEIHFLADPPLFDKAFHQISLTGSWTLGEEHVVILRYRERVRNCKPRIMERWKEYATAVRRIQPRKLKLHPISQNGGFDQLFQEKGFCYTEFVVPIGQTLSAVSSNENILLLRLLHLGVPYLYLLHSIERRPDWAKELRSTLRDWLEKLQTLDGFPHALAKRRMQRSPFASEGTLLWDDPEMIPFLTTREVIIR